MSGLTTALADIWRLAWPYFNVREAGTVRVGRFTLTMQERFIAIAFIAVIIALNLAQVQISVLLSYFNRDWFDAIQNKNGTAFWSLLFFTWVPWVVVLIISYLTEYVLTAALTIRWRTWMTKDLTERWLDRDTHYRLQFVGTDGVDNPDQRIQEDNNKFISYTLSLSVGILNQVSTLVSFAVILWGLSANLTLPGTATTIPGLLVWAALIYASVGTVLTHLIGKKLIPLNFQQEHYEANFRFSLARLREYAESVALLKGEQAEKEHLGERFRSIQKNFYAIVNVRKYLMAFTQFYGSSASVVPYIVVAPFYFLDKVTLGVMTQTAQSFARVEGAMAFFIGAYTTIAEYKAVVDRLTGFRSAIGRARGLGSKPPHIVQGTSADGNLSVDDLSVSLPDGRALIAPHGLTFAKGAATLVTGPSGSGKSTLFRAIAGIWPFGEGRVLVPRGARIMLLPQRPYLPIGELREAVTYPAIAGSFGDADIAAALQAVRLGHLAGRLGESASWSQTLSLGEQQRLAVARALLAKPDWLFLDEATAALDEPTEAVIYEVVKTHLPDATVVSIGHRSTLVAFHDRRVEFVAQEGGGFQPRPVAVKVAEPA